jgi:hypothetical protein
MKSTDELDRDYIKILEMLTEINKNLAQLNLGLYGDEKNGATGVIARVARLEFQINEIFLEIEKIKKVNDLQETAIKAKSHLKGDWWNIVVIVAKVIGGVFSILGFIAAWYYIIKGGLPADAAL